MLRIYFNTVSHIFGIENSLKKSYRIKQLNGSDKNPYCGR